MGQSSKNNSDKLLDFLEMVTKNDGITIEDACQELEVTYRSIYRYVNLLLDKDWIIKEKKSHKDKAIIVFNWEYFDKLKGDK